MIPDQGTKILKATWYGQKKKTTKKSKIHCTFAEKKKKAGGGDRKHQGWGRCWNFRAGGQGGGDNLFLTMPHGMWNLVV